MLERLGVRAVRASARVTPVDAPATRVVGLVLPAGAGPTWRKCATPSPGVLRHVVRNARARQRTGLSSLPGYRRARSLSFAPTRGICARARRLSASPYVEQALAGNPRIAGLLVRLFFARFGGAGDEAASRPMPQRWTKSRTWTRTGSCSFLAVVQATTRTNYFLNKPYLSFKLDPKRVPACPSRGRCSRSGCTRRASRACTCAAGGWRAAACAGRTAWRTSAPRSSG